MTAFLLMAWTGFVGAWALLLLEQRRLVRAGLILSPEEGEQAERTSTQRGAGAICSTPRVALLLPVRNNAQGGRRCVVGALKQRGVCLRIIVADDRSDEPHASEIRSLTQMDPRVETLRIDRLPEGWLGKSHALWRAASLVGVDEQWLLFLDDDCQLESPWAIRAAIERAERRGADLLTLWPRHDAGSFWEHMLIPLCGGVIALWFGPRRWRLSLRRPYANGQFLLIRAERHRSLGGHMAVRDSLIEDVALARAAQRDGARLEAASGRDLFSVRMYSDAKGVFDGWTRIFVGAIASPARLYLSLQWVLFGSILPFVAAPVIALAMVRRAAHGEMIEPALLAAGVINGAHLALLGVVSWRFWGLGGCRRRYLPLYPISAAGVAIILCMALWRLGVRRRIVWRGVKYRITRQGRIVAA